MLPHQRDGCIGLRADRQTDGCVEWQKQLPPYSTASGTAATPAHAQCARSHGRAVRGGRRGMRTRKRRRAHRRRRRRQGPPRGHPGPPRPSTSARATTSRSRAVPVRDAQLGRPGMRAHGCGLDPGSSEVRSSCPQSSCAYNCGRAPGGAALDAPDIDVSDWRQGEVSLGRVAQRARVVREMLL